MLRFLTARGHEYTVKHLVEHDMTGAEAPDCAVENYEEFLQKKEVPSGAYIFTDMERLMPWELRVVGEAYSALAGDPRCRVLNNPAKVMCRYELLRNMQAEGINEFEAIRADERRRPQKYPVFVRNEQDHGRPLSTELLKNWEELAAALEKARTDGMSLRGLLIVGYAAEAFDGPWFRKFNTFRVGDEVFGHHLVIEDSWVVKYGNDKVKLPEEYKVFEQKFVKENWHADVLRRVFTMAGIEYGRADWGIVGGKVQVYEINTNPYVSGEAGSTNPTRVATMAISTRKLCESLAALEKGLGSGTVKLGGKLLEEWRKGRKWWVRGEKRP